MQKACFYVSPAYSDDRVFRESDPLNRDDILRPYRALKDELARRGFELRTQDLHPPEDSAFSLYLDAPKRLPAAQAANRSYLILLESELIHPADYAPGRHRNFQKVFTWSEKLLGLGDKYVRIHVPQVVPEHAARPSFFEREGLCCLIAGGKLSLHPNELYSERIRWIRWFEKNHPSAFHFYGAGWKRLWMTGPLWIRAINKIPFWRRLLYPPFPSYRGTVADKFAKLAEYKFCICFENARDIEGYVTEKIFDCFFSGTVPIYRGPSRITEMIPADCFLDLRDFASREDVYERLVTMTDLEFAGYQTRAAAFLRSEKFAPFSIPAFVDVVVGNCVGRLG